MTNKTNDMINNNATDEFRRPVLAYQVVLVMDVCLLLVISVSNLLVIMTTTLVRRLHTPDNVIIAGLAIADILVGVWNIPGYILEDMESTMLIQSSYEWSCRMKYISRVTCQGSSLSLLTVMCLDRGFAINFPFQYRKYVTNSSATCCIIVVFVLEITRSVIMYGFFLEFDESKDIEKRCFHDNTPEWYNGYFMSAKQGTQISISLCACLVVVVTCLRHLHELRRIDVNKARSNIRAMKITSFLMFLFMILWAPTFLIPVVISHMSAFDSTVYILLTRPSRLANSFVNAIVYATVRKTYRHAYMYMLTTPPWRWNRFDIQRKTTRATSFTATVVHKERPSNRHLHTLEESSFYGSNTTIITKL